MADEDEKRKPQPDPREAKLAQALRANLRRRKVAPATPAPKARKTSMD